MRQDVTMYFRAVATLLSSLFLAGCSYFGIEDQADVAAKKEANNKTIGAACRFSTRSIEQCYDKNPKAVKADVFQGWKDMDIYMRENNLTGVPPSDGLAEPIASTSSSSTESPNEQ